MQVTVTEVQVAVLGGADGRSGDGGGDDAGGHSGDVVLVVEVLVLMVEVLVLVVEVFVLVVTELLFVVVVLEASLDGAAGGNGGRRYVGGSLVIGGRYILLKLGQVDVNSHMNKLADLPNWVHGAGPIVFAVGEINLGNFR